jgi:hypothetical protein
LAPWQVARSGGVKGSGIGRFRRYIIDRLP